MRFNIAGNNVLFIAFSANGIINRIPELQQRLRIRRHALRESQHFASRLWPTAMAAALAPDRVAASVAWAVPPAGPGPGVAAIL